MIATVTFNPAVDQTVHVDEPMRPDAVLRSTDARFDAGGKGINVSKYLVELGTETLATGILGGFLGEFVDGRLADDGVPRDFVAIDGQTRLNTTVLADAEYKINHAGPTVGTATVGEVVDTIEAYAPDTVVVAGSLPPGLDVGAIDQVARAGDWETAVDVGGQCLPELDEHYALCKPNRAELAAATGMPTDTVEECIAAAEHLRESGFDRVVASLGADGAILTTETRSLHASAIDVDVVDTVGAGDAMLSGVLAALDRGADEESALVHGVAVSSRVVAVPGTKVPPFADLDVTAEGLSVSAY